MARRILLAVALGAAAGALVGACGERLHHPPQDQAIRHAILLRAEIARERTTTH